MNYTREAATRYSFLLAVPAVLVSGLFEALKIGDDKTSAWGPTIVHAPIIPSMLRGIALGALMALVGILFFLRKSQGERGLLTRLGRRACSPHRGQHRRGRGVGFG